MRKTLSLFIRDYEGTRLVLNEVVPGSEWVLSGEAPVGFLPAQEPDTTTGHWPGWILVGDGPEDRWHREAFVGTEPDGTYELCGPKVQGNPDNFEKHVLVPHGKEILHDAPREFESLKAYLESREMEGIVWHHPDGRMVKIKRRDFFKPSKQKKYQ
jgi:hypothetical protein